MKDFTKVQFHGQFRDYQQNVLDHSGTYLKDGRIHIVAAPGSGKTVLGLELLRRLGSPALVLSPTLTIREQWRQRFAEKFLPPGESVEEYVSCDLRCPALINSITYQALYAAVTGQRSAEEAEDDGSDGPEESFSGCDIYACVRDAGIHTICLDEAHHLKSQWQRSLELFLAEMQGEAAIVSLTATPPYDSTPAEWRRYISLCGEIDEEIFVPQLVAQKTLCPHQDYVYFSYPTDEEAELMFSHREKTLLFLGDLVTGQPFRDMLAASGLLAENQNTEEFILDYPRECAALFCLAQQGDIPISQTIIRLVSPRGSLPGFTLELGQEAVQFLLDHPERFSPELTEKLRRELQREGLLERKKVCLVSDEKLNRMLISSIGKLRGIGEIVQAESGAMGKGLRLLILTDYIRREMAKYIGSNEPLTVMGAVPVFEAVRRQCGDGVRPALLSGTLVILPDDAATEAESIARERDISLTVKPMGCGYSELCFVGSNRDKVAVVTEAFRRGAIRVLVGTKSLLGEGWDLPCINAIILASFVDSFVQSNQMRGRAIRSAPADPQKTANIWHLVTVEPPFVSENPAVRTLLFADDGGRTVKSADYEGLERRFACFLGPAYHRDVIESGIERLDIPGSPFHKENVELMNRQMLELSANRRAMAERWERAQFGGAFMEILDADVLPRTVRPGGFLFHNALSGLLLAGVDSLVLLGITGFLVGGVFAPAVLLPGLAMSIPVTVSLVRTLSHSLRFVSPKRAILTLGVCVLATLRAMGEIESPQASVLVDSDPLGAEILCALAGATAREKRVFAEAVRELLSPVDNPRYVLIRKKSLSGGKRSDYINSYPCPSVIGAKKETAELLARNLQKAAGPFEAVYTRSEGGRQELLRCRKKSYLNGNARLSGKKIVKF